MSRMFSLVAGLALAVTVFGCAETVKEKKVQIKTPTDPLVPAVTILEQYANGQPMGSEATSFPNLVEELRKADPAKADILQKGLDDLQKSPESARAGKAKALLEQLKPAAKSP
ncbi:MAG: hypothetical protein NUV77_00040 [Thermoguttaceae bacterium]|nr:hypothetical protein [Thermoguttaceae bacterium]